MAKNKIEGVFESISQEVTDLLQKPVAEPDRQLCLFDEFEEYNAEQVAKNPKNNAGLTWAQEVFAQLIARGYSKVESYRLSHPASKTQNLKTIYPKASRLAKEGKVGARIDAVRAQLASRALMPPSEFFERITDLARKGDKESLFKIGQIHGVFKPEKDVAVNVGPTVIVQAVDYSTALGASDSLAKKPAAGTKEKETEAAG